MLEVLVPLFIGYTLGIISVVFGSHMTCSMMKGGTVFTDPPEPQGDVFTVETPDEMSLFPDDITTPEQEHILGRTSEFIEKFNAKAGR